MNDGLCDGWVEEWNILLMEEFFASDFIVALANQETSVGVPGEQEFYARGVHYCATCDGAFYRDKRLVIIGGGNSAVQESIFLTRFASHIDILVRGNAFKASEILQHELNEKHKDKITVHFNITSNEIVGTKPTDGSIAKVTTVKGTDKTTGVAGW